MSETAEEIAATPEPLEQFVAELVKYLRHTEGCPTNSDGDESACLCSLTPTLLSLRDDHGIHVVRCRRCGVHAETPDGTEDWAYRTEKHDGHPVECFYCNGCAVAEGA